MQWAIVLTLGASAISFSDPLLLTVHITRLPTLRHGVKFLFFWLTELRATKL